MRESSISMTGLYVSRLLIMVKTDMLHIRELLKWRRKSLKQRLGKEALTLASDFTFAAAVDETTLVFFVLLWLSLRAFWWTHKGLVIAGTLCFAEASLLSWCQWCQIIVMVGSSVIRFIATVAVAIAVSISISLAQNKRRRCHGKEHYKESYQCMWHSYCSHFWLALLYVFLLLLIYLNMS